jgi:hypothetical protein
VVAASPEQTFAAVAQLRGGDLRSPVLQALRAHWVLLGERPGWEIVLGPAGRFWRPRWDDVGPRELQRYDRPRSATIALACTVLPVERGQTLLSFATAVTVPGPVARRWVDLYWQRVRPVARLVARQLLHALDDEATGRHRFARN